MGSIIVPFCGLYLGSYKVINPQKQLLWSAWVEQRPAPKTQTTTKRLVTLLRGKENRRSDLLLKPKALNPVESSADKAPSSRSDLPSKTASWLERNAHGGGGVEVTHGKNLSGRPRQSSTA